MAVSKTKKQEIVKELGDKLGRQKAVVFADFTGLKVKDLAGLKAKLRENGAEFKVAKKTLMKVAFKEKGINIDPKTLAGEIALVMGYNDETAPAKTVYEFSRTNQNIKILGGLLEKNALTLEQVLNLAKLPSKQELYAKLVGTMSAPSRNFAGVLQGNIRGLVTVLSKIKTA
ncbi:MAG: 50S ribosomal protein L10 [Candidatus Nealsonbacteria bacterium DGGOD1a]|jgi:Ribosomal protein L10|nr:MAG: 50S ribosomal protein L10 [Candidatus Nealsonbacteria bacterium DGGOD1a]